MSRQERWIRGQQMNCFACLRRSISRDRPILMVTHSVKAASTANRVLFIKDGEVFHQLYRGNMSNEELYEKISATLTALTTGGEDNA